MRQIILDTETTGREVAEGHRIIEIGCIEMIDRRFTERTFHHYVKADRDSEPGALAVHGITTEFLADKPLFKAIVDDFLEFITGAQLIIHNAPFDVAFLNNELILAGKKNKTITDYCSVLDTLPLARQMHPGQRNSLDALCKRYNVNNSHRNLHGALLDSELLAQVYLAMTGGQATLFDEETASTTNATSVQNNKLTITVDLPVITANAEELLAHQARIKTIEKSSGKNLWQE